MGCACSCRRQEVGGLSVSSWGCCYRRCCFCGMCSVVHPFSGKRNATSPLRNASVPSSTGLLGITSESPETTLEPAISQHSERTDLPNSRASIASDVGENVGEAPLISSEQIKEQDVQKDKATLHVANKKSRGFGSIESILFLSEDEDNCPICLEEYDKENPKIDTVCEHHFHLCCILEWMERSDNCPMCDKEIVLYESL